ncbi:MAG: hypothetical protein CTY30_09945, partial [Methylocystis sp.]
TDPRVASDADNPVTLAQARGGRGRGGGFSGPGEATPSQLGRLENTARLAREAEARVREIDPSWKPEPTLIDPNNIEARIARNESATRQANERYSEHLRELYGDFALPAQRDSAQRGNLTGPRALVRRQDDPETRRGAERENQSADILWLNGHNVEQKPDVPGPKRPDYRIDGEVFDNYAPKTNNVRNVWRTVFEKIEENQTRNVVINLQDSNLTLSQIEEQFRANPISNLGKIWILDQRGNLIYLKGSW